MAKPGAISKKMTTVICFNSFTKKDAAIDFNYRFKELLPHAMKNHQLWEFFYALKIKTIHLKLIPPKVVKLPQQSAICPGR